MKKQLIAVLAAVSMTVTSLPMVSLAADNAPEPILQYTFDGKNELADQNGKNKLTLLGGASITEDGNTGKALLLDGEDDFAQLPDNIMSEEMTITAWVKINKFTVWGRVFDFGTDSSENFFFAPYSGGASRTEIKTKDGADTMDAVQETELDWVHYAVTVGNNTVSYYRNGRLISSKKITQSLGEMNNVANYIGKSHYDGDAYLAAAVDDFRVYDTALDRNEICNVMAEGEITPEVLLKSYSIEDGQIITGDKIELPKIGALTWYENDNLGLIDVETGAVKHNENTEKVTLAADVDGIVQTYTVYVTGTDENPYTVNIDASDRSKDVSDIMWGLFFEDINSAADGGLYAEMVQNRSFEMDDHLYSWETSNAWINTYNPMNENNPTYITLGGNQTSGKEHDGGEITNDGFMGMSIKAGETYNFSMYARGVHASPDMISVSLENQYISLENAGEMESGWIKLVGTVTAETTTDLAKLTINNIPSSDLDVDMVSLIPQNTYKGHGLRKDLMEQLEAMHPKFLRFPGGCAAEGKTMETAWNWKDTVGDISERKEMINIWDTDGTYQMTYGLGFYEYFQMCEDLGMKPVPILNCGIACQVRSGSATDEEHLVPMDELQPYIDDALDLIAFANGTDENNEWTKKRIEMGHPEPFNMKYIGIGNEQYGEIYWERYAEFAKQIHEQYPDINLVTTSGTASSGTGNDLAWNWANENTELADRMDEHYYETADWFRTHAYRYDNYRRDTNTKVFLGEYASKGNLWYNALSEAAFMTGLERNADVVRMASYAPMFAKYGNVQWSAANMIWFTNDDYMLTPNYYVQSLFSNNQGDYSLPTEVTLNGIEKDDTFKGTIAVGSWGTHNEFKDITLQQIGEPIFELAPQNDEWKTEKGEWTVNDEGAFVQSSDETGAIAWLDDGENNANANNYILSLKAKKTAGGEGFQIGVAAEDGLNYYRVNIGGWGNTTAKIQHIVNGVSAEVGNVAEQSYVGDVHINDDEWYDVKVEVTDYEIKAYLNGEFICSYSKPKEYGPVYASSVYDEETGNVIVKVVNTIDSDVNIGINVNGANVTSNIAKTTVMSGDTSLENSLENKNAIVPVEGEITNAGDSFTYAAPADSLSVIRLSTDNAVHETYIEGYDDGTFRPDNTITRAETAAVILKLCGDMGKPMNLPQRFDDVGDAWYSKAVNFAADRGYITGYEDGTFRPENPITRSEFAVILCNYLDLTPGNHPEFSDVNFDFWASEYIDILSVYGYISGYPDGTFRPDNTITRAEAVTMINKALGRKVPSVLPQNPFSDLSPLHWAFGQILTAVN